MGNATKTTTRRKYLLCVAEVVGVQDVRRGNHKTGDRVRFRVVRGQAEAGREVVADLPCPARADQADLDLRSALVGRPAGGAEPTDLTALLGQRYAIWAGRTPTGPYRLMLIGRRMDG